MLLPLLSRLLQPQLSSHLLPTMLQPLLSSLSPQPTMLSPLSTLLLLCLLTPSPTTTTLSTTPPSPTVFSAQNTLPRTDQSNMLSSVRLKPKPTQLSSTPHPMLFLVLSHTPTIMLL